MRQKKDEFSLNLYTRFILVTLRANSVRRASVFRSEV